MGSVFVYMSHPELQSLVPMTGVESDAAEERAKKTNALGAMEIAIEQFAAAAVGHWKGDKLAERAFMLQRRRLGAFITVLLIWKQVEEMNIDSLSDLNKMIAAVDLSEMPWMADSYQKLQAAMRARIQANSGRDYDSAKILADLGKSGVLFVGLTHLRNRVHYLEALCRQEQLGEGRSDKGSPTAQ
jgi:hypothetical protein